MKKREPDQEKIEEIIKKAKEYMQMSNALEVDAAFGRAAKEILADKYPGAWGQYKQTAKGIYLNRENKEKERDTAEYKHEELLRGAQEAAWARKDAYAEEAEKNEEELAAERSRWIKNK